jgi:hypothetical protein
MDCPDYEHVKYYGNYLLGPLSTFCLLLSIALYANDSHQRKPPGKIVVMFQLHSLLMYLSYTSSWPYFEE